MTIPDTQHDSAEGTAAGQPATASTDEDQNPQGEPEGNQHDDDTGEQDTGDGNPAHEAKRYRLRLREAERERDELRDTLTRTRQAAVDHAVATAGLDPRLLTAAGHTVDNFVGDDGLIDHAALTEAITATASEFRVNRGRLAPNPQQGAGGGQPRRPASWSEALKSR